jgi:putative membrane protein
MFSWTWEPGLLFGLGSQAALYLSFIGPLRRWFPGAAPVPQWQILTFLLGNLTLFIALVTPLGTLSDGYLLSAHMVQHLLLTLIAPPLLLIGTPRWLFRPLLRLPYALPIGQFLTNPLVAFLAYNMTFLIWHAPQFYEASLRIQPVHIAQHVAFIVTATLTWWPIFSPMDELPRLSPPLQCLYLFVQVLPMKVLAALITFANIVIYPTYADAPRVWGISVMDDQQLAGLLMWIPGFLILFAVFTVVFLRFMDNDEYRPVV